MIKIYRYENQEKSLVHCGYFPPSRCLRLYSKQAPERRDFLFSECRMINKIPPNQQRLGGIFISMNKFSYLATRSNHFTIESITIMEAAVAPTNTNQQAQIGTVV